MEHFVGCTSPIPINENNPHILKHTYVAKMARCFLSFISCLSPESGVKAAKDDNINIVI